MRTILFIMSLSWLFFGTSQATQLNQLQYLTEEYPPYNYSKGDVVTGVAVDLLLAASSQVDASLEENDISVQPWPRAYRSALIRPNTVLFSTTRTEAREELFKWAGPIISTRIVVLAKRERDLKVLSPMDLAKYRIGVIRDDVGEQLLLSLGVPRDSMVESSVPQTLAQQFAKDRIDMWAYEENVARWWLKKSDLEGDDLEAIYVLSEGELYFAFNLSISDDVVSELQRGINAVKKRLGSDSRSQYEEILEKYF